MENPDLRALIGMSADQKGVRIRRIEPTASESNTLKPSDVILSFDGVNIANDGTGHSLFTPFYHILFFSLSLVVFALMLSHPIW